MCDLIQLHSKLT